MMKIATANLKIDMVYVKYLQNKKGIRITMIRKNCTTCKWLKYGICEHSELEIRDKIKDAIVDHIEVSFDGDIQSKLEETIEQYCPNLTEEAKQDLIEAISTTCANHLADPRNMYLVDDGFVPDDDFWCIYWE